MDIIVLGVYNPIEKERLNSIISQIDDLEIYWDYDHFNIEASSGINTLRKVYNLFGTGVLVKKDASTSFTSYPLIYEVSESVIGKNNDPILFHFFKNLRKAKIPKIIIAFADEWDENTLVRVERCPVGSLKDRLSSIFVWCESYVDLINNSEIRGDGHPLVLEVEP